MEAGASFACEFPSRSRSLGTREGVPELGNKGKDSGRSNIL